MIRPLTRLSLAAAMSLGIAASAMAAPVTYTVDGSHSFARFSYSHLGLSTQLSSFKATSGTIVLDQEAKTGSVDITIDTTSVETGNEAFNGHIQGPDFLDTANHPTATFKSTKVNFDGDKPVSVDGDLTIKGVTKQVSFEITGFAAKPHPMLKKEALGADAKTAIKRSEFNAGKFAPGVGDDVTITIAVEALQQ